MEAKAVPKPLFSWKASEYVAHHKPAIWYITFFLVAAAITGLVYIVLSRDIFAAIVVALMFIALFVYAVRKPETLLYEIASDGVSVGSKHYTYNRFRAFSVVQTTGVPTIALEPLQRFSLPITMYCAPEDANKIAGILDRYLPRSDRQPDFIDRLTHYLRF